MRKISVFILILLSAAVVFCSCKVVKHSDTEQKNEEEVTFYFENEDFDAAAYAAENWDTRVVPEISGNAVELEVLLEELSKDLEKASVEYGVKKEDTSPCSFAVKAEVSVRQIDRESSAGLMIVDIPDLTGNGFCMIQIGPVIKKSMVRDYLSFIKFGDFENQIEFANVSKELNFYIRDNVVGKINEDQQEGTVSFTGVYTYDKTGAVLITPIQIDLFGGNE